jgi:hypothetical protein
MGGEETLVPANNHSSDRAGKGTNILISPLTSPITTMIVGRDQRLFAAHEDVLSASPLNEIGRTFSLVRQGQLLCTVLEKLLIQSSTKERRRGEQFLEDGAKQLTLPDE